MAARNVPICFDFVAMLAVVLMPAWVWAGEADRPNIVILYADDMGYGDLLSYNPQSKIPTPHLDKLASQGARFTDAHSSSGICTPSRYALLTGRYHWRDFHNIVNSFGSSVFKPQQLTLPKMLHENGYETACIGKWHLGWDWKAIRKHKGNEPDAFDWSKPIPGGPLAQGFTSYFGDDVINFPPYTWIENDRVLTPPDAMSNPDGWPAIKEGNWEARPGPMVADWNPYDVVPTLTGTGVDFIASHKPGQAPFFLYFAFPSPHAPIIPSDSFDHTSQAGAYGDWVVQIDDTVGQLLDALTKAGLDDNTIVIFTADNGPEHYAYARDAKFGHWSSAPLRGVKRDIYEGGHRVPLLIRWPGVTKPGEVRDALVSQIDLMATFATMLGITLPPDAAQDSREMLAYLRDQAPQIRTSHVHNTFPNAFAIREGDWVLINARTGYHSKVVGDWEQRHAYPADDNNPTELYNLAADPGQRRNLASEYPERVKRMQTLLAKLRRHDGNGAPQK